MSNKRYDMITQEHRCAERKSVKLLYISTAKYGGDWHSLPHIHNCTELFYVVGGVGQFQIMDSMISVTPDDMVVVNPQVEHTEVSLNAHPLEYIVLGVDGLEFSGGVGDSRYRIYNFHQYRNDLLGILRRILQEIEQKQEGCQEICQNLLDVLIVLMMRYTDFHLSSTATRRASKECAAVKRYIDANFKESITLDQLAEMAHVNKYYLVHSFSREYNTSPINYLIERRVQESCYLLSNTDHSLSQISHLMGFSSPSYFSQSFRKTKGMSPLEYRKQRRAERAAAAQEEAET